MDQASSSSSSHYCTWRTVFFIPAPDEKLQTDLFLHSHQPSVCIPFTKQKLCYYVRSKGIFSPASDTTWFSTPLTLRSGDLLEGLLLSEALKNQSMAKAEISGWIYYWAPTKCCTYFVCTKWKFLNVTSISQGFKLHFYFLLFLFLFFTFIYLFILQKILLVSQKNCFL